MKNDLILNTQQTSGAKSVSAAAARVQPSAAPPLAFQALIERLRDHARTLERSAEQPLRAGDLPGALQAAQSSLQDALSIADGLVEAYRSSLVRSNPLPRDPTR